MPSDRSKWEERYRTAAESGTAKAKAPSIFVATWAGRLRGRVLDVASGTGRNALLLARHGLQVDAIDIAASALDALQREATSQGLAVHAVQADLQHWPLRPSIYDAAIQVRYLQRDLFPALRHCLKPGGILLLETFLIDQRDRGHPKNPDFLLERGELTRRFADWEILESEEGDLPSETGPTFLARLAARKPFPKDAG